MYSKCYIGLNQYEKAFDILLPNIIENGLASNSKLITATLNALLKNYKKQELKTQFENCFKNVSVEKEKRNKNEYKSYYINMSLLILSVGFLFKVSAAPFHFWSPDVYDAIPTIVTTFVAIVAKISILIFLCTPSKKNSSIKKS